jgi:hypothetical protein
MQARVGTARGGCVMHLIPMGLIMLVISTAADNRHTDPHYRTGSDSLPVPGTQVMSLFVNTIPVNKQSRSHPVEQLKQLEGLPQKNKDPLTPKGSKRPWLNAKRPF